MTKFCDVAVIVVGYTWRDEGEYAAPEQEGPWNDHLLREPLTAEDEPYARKVAELNKALGKAAGAAGIGGDRTSLALHHADKKLIEAVAAVNRRTRGP
jgi:beta-glucosidase